VIIGKPGTEGKDGGDSGKIGQGGKGGFGGDVTIFVQDKLLTFDADSDFSSFVKTNVMRIFCLFHQLKLSIDLLKT